MTHTDDRGAYEFSGLRPGNYRLVVDAQPWYAVSARASQGALDPSLDVVYPTTWYPGVADPRLAGDLEARGGDDLRADFHLTPVPSGHLHIGGIGNPTNGVQAPPSRIPVLHRVDPTSENQVFTLANSRPDARGQIDVGGLSPGIYEVRLPGADRSDRTEMIEVTANGVASLDAGDTNGTMARVKLHFATPDDSYRAEFGRTPSAQLVAADASDRSFASDFERGANGRSSRRDPGANGAEQFFEVPPGKYEVKLDAPPGLYLDGVAQNGVQVATRFVTLGRGDSTLTIHMGTTHARIYGMAKDKDGPSVGATVLLVPVTVEDENSLVPVRMEQTNSDGSFGIANVIPSRYILLIVRGGWQINWADAVTLRRYLALGLALDVRRDSDLNEDVLPLKP